MVDSVTIGFTKTIFATGPSNEKLMLETRTPLRLLALECTARDGNITMHRRKTLKTWVMRKRVCDFI